MLKNKNTIIVASIIVIVVILVLISKTPTPSSVAESSLATSAVFQIASSSQPIINTYNSATSSFVTITSPNGYKSQVISTFDGKQYHTFATSTPLTTEDMAKIQADIKAQQKAMQDMFRQQEELMRQQEKIFREMSGMLY